MRFDHIVVHADNDPRMLHDLQATLQDAGYFFDPGSGSRSREFRAANINIGDEYIEIVRLMKRGIKVWEPAWVTAYDEGQRGAFCIFLDVEDITSSVEEIGKAGFEASGPASLRYPYLMGLIRINAPYRIYYLPRFPGSTLQVALMQYSPSNRREAALAGLTPNAQQNGINGIRVVEIYLPALEDSLPLLKAVFPDLEQDDGSWLALAGKTYLRFCESANGLTHLRLNTVTSQRRLLGKRFQIENVEVRTTGG